MHSDREFVYKVLGKYLRISDRSIMDAAYNAEIKALEPRLGVKDEALQAILEATDGVDAFVIVARRQDELSDAVEVVVYGSVSAPAPVGSGHPLGALPPEPARPIRAGKSSLF